jgi:hypothetical protein
MNGSRASLCIDSGNPRVGHADAAGAVARATASARGGASAAGGSGSGGCGCGKSLAGGTGAAAVAEGVAGLASWPGRARAFSVMHADGVMYADANANASARRNLIRREGCRRPGVGGRRTMGQCTGSSLPTPPRHRTRGAAAAMRSTTLSSIWIVFARRHLFGSARRPKVFTRRENK